MWCDIVTGDVTNQMVSAIENNDLERVKKLLPKLKDPHSANFKFHCILDHSTNRPDIFEYLIDKIDDHNIHNLTLLMRYTTEFLFEKPTEHIVSLILKHTKNIEITTDDTGSTALIKLVQTTRNCCSRDTYTLLKKIMKLFIDNNANPFIMNYSNESSITYATFAFDIKDIIDILDILLKTKHKGYISIRNIYCLFELHDGIQHLYDATELLLPYIEDINEIYRDHTILWHAHHMNVNLDVIELLIVHGAL